MSSRDTSTLAGASLVSGLLAYVVFAATTRALGPADAAPVSVLWSYWSLAAAAISFPLQHWLTKTVAAHGGFLAARPVLPRLMAIAAAATVATGLTSWLLRDALFGRNDALFPLLVAALTLGSALMGVVRGGLGARQRFGDLALTMLAENGTRCAGVLALALTGIDDPVAYGAAIAAGHLTGLLWPAALKFPATGQPSETNSALSHLTGASSGQLLAQVVLTSGPVVLALHGGTPTEVTALFVGLAIYRAPYIVAMGVVSQLTGRLTTLVVEGRLADLRRFRVALLTGTLTVGAVAIVVGLWAGPPLVRLVFGDDVVLDPATSAVLAVGSVFAVSNLVASILVIAADRTRLTTLAWVAGVTVAAGVLLVDLDALHRIALGFMLAEAGAFVVLVGAGRHAGRSPAAS